MGGEEPVSTEMWQSVLDSLWQPTVGWENVPE
jgi:hypothetical protein